MVQNSLTTHKEVDLGFATFGDGSERLYPAPSKNGVSERIANPAKTLVELRGIEPLTLRLPERSAISQNN